MSLVQLVETIAKALVDEPEEVIVEEVDSNSGPLIELQVAKNDVGKVIGKDGRTAQSIRAVLSAASHKEGRRVHLDIVD